MRTQQHFKYYKIITFILRKCNMGYMRIYGLDVKDRVRTENHPKFWRDRVRAYTARNYSAADRYQIASDTLSARY